MAGENASETRGVKDDQGSQKSGGGKKGGGGKSPPQSQAGDKKSQAGSEKAQPKRSSNKIYRTPPTPEPEILMDKEKTFVLDCRAVSNISNIYANGNPRLGSVIPPYNSQWDIGTARYYEFHGVDQTLMNTEQNNGGTSIEGKIIDYSYQNGSSAQYLRTRNNVGFGHSRQEVGGHGSVGDDIKPMFGYNGDFGYRRNTPNLRNKPSPFGVGTWSAIYSTPRTEKAGGSQAGGSQAGGSQRGGSQAEGSQAGGSQAGGSKAGTARSSRAAN